MQMSVLLLCSGFYELAPLLDYITDILQDVVSDDVSTYSNQQLGQLNATYVQTNQNVAPEVYATLRTSGAYLPVSSADSMAVCMYAYDMLAGYM